MPRCSPSPLLSSNGRGGAPRQRAMAMVVLPLLLPLRPPRSPALPAAPAVAVAAAAAAARMGLEWGPHCLPPPPRRRCWCPPVRRLRRRPRREPNRCRCRCSPRPVRSGEQRAPGRVAR
ncbi:unnamed protein product, partial [Ectocarpus sp. 12 AP-2014]